MTNIYIFSVLLGIEQHGFFSGSNFLLPWELRTNESSTSVIRKNTENVINDGGEEQWPAPGEASKSISTAATGTHLPIFQTTAKLMMLAKDVGKFEALDSAAKNPAPVKQQKGRKEDKQRFSGIKAFVGNEYECPRGHRYHLNYLS